MGQSHSIKILTPLYGGIFFLQFCYIIYIILLGIVTGFHTGEGCFGKCIFHLVDGSNHPLGILTAVACHLQQFLHTLTIFLLNLFAVFVVLQIIVPVWQTCGSCFQIDHIHTGVLQVTIYSNTEEGIGQQMQMNICQ